MRVSLVCPTNDYGESSSRGIYYPMGILLVGSLVKDTFPNWEVDVIDGELHSKADLETRIKGCDVLGVSANTSNYQNCLDLARFAKSYGTKTVVAGGPHVSAVMKPGDRKIPMADLILRNRPEIDAAIVHDGEHAFLKFLMELQKATPNFAKIDNLVWRDRDQLGIVRHNQVIPPTTPPRSIDMDFSLMDMRRYWQEHGKQYPAMSPQFIEGFTHVGCAWREKLGCVFCDIPYPLNNYQSPGRFWRDLREAKHRFGVQSFKDYGDCLTGNPERVKALLDARPSDLEDIEFSCYGRSKEIDETMADMLKGLNVRYVYIGFDSGNDKMLRKMQEGYTVRANYRATELLENRGINITGSLIMGAPEESELTIADTEKFAREILQFPNISGLSCSVLTPFPGAPMSRRFLEANPHYAETDVWETEQAQRDWVKHFCQAQYEYIEAKAQEINGLNPSSRKRYFGLKKGN